MSMRSLSLVALLGCGPAPEGAGPKDGPPTAADSPAPDTQSEETGDGSDGAGDSAETGADGGEGSDGAETGDSGEPPELVEPLPSRLDPLDFCLTWWPDNFRSSSGTYAAVRAVQSGTYALRFDLSRASPAGLSQGPMSLSLPELLTSEDDDLASLPEVEVSYEVQSGALSRPATTFEGRDGSTTNPSELVDMGRFLQRVEIPAVSYGEVAEGSVSLAAGARHLALSQRARRSSGEGALTLRQRWTGALLGEWTEEEWLEEGRALRLTDGSGEGWIFVLPEAEEGVSLSLSWEGAELVAEAVVAEPVADQDYILPLLALPASTTSEEQLEVWLHPGETVQVQMAQLQRDGSGGEVAEPAVYDPERGVYVLTLGNLSDVGAGAWPDWTVESTHNWYNRHAVQITSLASAPISVPLVYEGGNNAAFYIVGGSPFYRDVNGEPIGAPVQISKNWHESPFWYHLYSNLLVQPGLEELELTFAHSRWGSAYAVSHAQLALVGWGVNQQWDEAALGAFGESITYDPDRTLNRSAIDDIRPFQVDAAGEWGWTGNVGGADLLVYKDAGGTLQRLGRMRSLHEMTGPNLTRAIYAGRSADGKIEAEVRAEMGRTNDLVRVYLHLRYTFLEDVSYSRLSFFQVAADGYADNGFTRLAIGDEGGLIEDVEITDHRSTGYADEADRGLEMAGRWPWIMHYSNARSDGSLPEHLGNIGFVVRSFSAELGGLPLSLPYLNLIRTYNGGWSQIAAELGLPYDPEALVVPAGSTVEATVELLVPPADKEAWYGSEAGLEAVAAEDFDSPTMLWGFAAEGGLEVSATVGELLRSHPVELQAAEGLLAVDVELSGGRGLVPVSVRGLPRPDGWRLEVLEGGAWEAVDQSVEGQDWWQAVDNGEDFTLIYNLPGSARYRLLR